jgi:hypothetical protein
VCCCCDLHAILSNTCIFTVFSFHFHLTMHSLGGWLSPPPPPPNRYHNRKQGQPCLCTTAASR